MVVRQIIDNVLVPDTKKYLRVIAEQRIEIAHLRRQLADATAASREAAACPPALRDALDEEPTDWAGALALCERRIRDEPADLGVANEIDLAAVRHAASRLLEWRMDQGRRELEFVRALGDEVDRMHPGNCIGAALRRGEMRELVEF